MGAHDTITTAGTEGSRCGRGRPPFNRGVAQPVEHWAHTPGVARSIRASATKLHASARKATAPRPVVGSSLRVQGTTGHAPEKMARHIAIQRPAEEMPRVTFHPRTSLAISTYCAAMHRRQRLSMLRTASRAHSESLFDVCMPGIFTPGIDKP